MPKTKPSESALKPGHICTLIYGEAIPEWEVAEITGLSRRYLRDVASGKITGDAPRHQHLQGIYHYYYPVTHVEAWLHGHAPGRTLKDILNFREYMDFVRLNSEHDDNI